MTVTDTVEHEDGSATLTFDLSPEEVKMILSAALLQAIKDLIIKGEQV